MATSTTSVALSPLLVKLNVTGLQKRDQPLYDFLSHLLFATGQVASAVGVASSSGGGGGGSTTNITNILQQFNLGDSGSGEDGSPGPPGPQGNPGSSGSTGASGAIGPATYLTDISAPDEVFPIPGPIGPQGNIGNTGNDGPAIFITAQDGMDGEPSSIPGPQGPQGNTGSAGSTGNDGPGIFLVNDIYPDDVLPIPGGQGPTGNPGATGNTGAPGQLQAVFLDDWNTPDVPIIAGIPSVSPIGSVFTIARTSTQSTTSTTVVNDNQLFFATGPNDVYQVTAYLFFTSTTVTTIDVKVGWTLPAAATMTEIVEGLATVATSADGQWTYRGQAQTTTPVPARTLGVLSTAVEAVTPVVIHGIVTMLGTAGTVQLQWAQNSASTTSPIVINIDSYLQYVRIR